ncbi:MAG: hypothetical protein V3U19_07800 [Thermodesulfobacteriota bacterium]
MIYIAPSNLFISAGRYPKTMISLTPKQKKNLLLLTVLLIAASMAYIPHRRYSYPLHRDEWDRIPWAQAIIRSQSMQYRDPVLGERMVTLNREIGFGVWLALVELVTDVPWWPFFRYSPIFITGLLVLSTYIFANRLGYGLESALFVSLLPTTVRFLGPAFLVPVSLGLIFIPLALFITFNATRWHHYLLLVLILLFLISVHAPTALALLIILVIYMVLAKDWRLLATLSLVFLAGVLVLVYYFKKEVAITTFRFETFIRFYDVFKEVGYLPTAFFIIGTFMLIRKHGKDAALVYASIIFLLINLAYRRLSWTLVVMPERNIIYLMLLMSIIAGYPLSKVRDKRIVVGIFLVVLFVSYQAHIGTPYYHIINEREFDDFVFIRDNIEGEKAVLDPGWALTFPSVTEKYVYSYIFPGSNKFYGGRNVEIFAFLGDKCKDTGFLRKNKISIVYSANGCDNEDLVKVRERVYVLG